MAGNDHTSIAERHEMLLSDNSDTCEVFGVPSWKTSLHGVIYPFDLLHIHHTRNSFYVPFLIF